MDTNLSEGLDRYIEFRVYLKKNANNVKEIEDAANELQDQISDMVSDPCAPDIFTEDVRYEINYGKQ